MTSVILRTLNAYPEWKTDEKIKEVINYVKTKEFPPRLNTKQKNRYEEKFGSAFQVEQGKLYYEPIKKGRIKIEIISPDKHEDKLKEIFNDKERGLGIGMETFYHQVARSYLGITRKKVMEYLRKQGNFSIGRKPRKKVNRSILAKTSNERWGIDLMEAARYRYLNKEDETNEDYDMKTEKEFVKNMEYFNQSEDGKYYKFILTCVDFYSKKMWARPLRNKTEDETLRGFKDIIKEADTKPRILQNDNGKEFTNKKMLDYLQKQNIKNVLTKPYSSTSNGLIEKTNSKLRNRMRDGFIRNDNLEWEKDLQLYVKNINSQKPSTGIYTPDELWEKGYTAPDKKELLQLEQKSSDTDTKETIQNITKAKSIQRGEKQIKSGLPDKVFQVGDKVRLALSAVLDKYGKLMKKRNKSGLGEGKYSAIQYGRRIYTIRRVYKGKDIESSLTDYYKKTGQRKDTAAPQNKLYYLSRYKYTLFHPKEQVDVRGKQFFGDDLLLVGRNNNIDPNVKSSRFKEINRFVAYEPTKKDKDNKKKKDEAIEKYDSEEEEEEEEEKEEEEPPRVLTAVDLKVIADEKKKAKEKAERAKEKEEIAKEKAKKKEERAKEKEQENIEKQQQQKDKQQELDFDERVETTTRSGRKATKFAGKGFDNNLTFIPYV